MDHSEFIENDNEIDGQFRKQCSSSSFTPRKQQSRVVDDMRSDTESGSDLEFESDSSSQSDSDNNLEEDDIEALFSVQSFYKRPSSMSSSSSSLSSTATSSKNLSLYSNQISESNVVVFNDKSSSSSKKASLREFKMFMSSTVSKIMQDPLDLEDRNSHLTDKEKAEEKYFHPFAIFLFCVVVSLKRSHIQEKQKRE